MNETNTVDHIQQELSLAENLGVAIMNLISLEEHMFFSANKTGKDRYYGMLNEVREMRKEMLKNILVTYEGEGWCIGKHLLASSMRLLEVGTKALKNGGTAEAKPYFAKSYRLFQMFWELAPRQKAPAAGAPVCAVAEMNCCKE